jgi:hypothetical protein
MKKIYIFAAVLALLTLSLNAQYQAEKKKAIQTATTEKKVGTPNYGIQKTVTLITSNRAPSRAPMRGDRATQTWSWSYGNGLPADWSFGDPTNTGWGDNGDGTYYIGVNDENIQPSEFSIQIPASVFTGYTNNVQVVIRAKADQGYNSQYISVNGDSKSITTSLANYTWTNVDVSNGMVINPKDSYTGLASITITGESASSGNTESETICEGTTTNEFLPIYGYYNDDFQINQMIYPENLLTNLVGKTLTSMTFYANGALGANLGTSVWTVKLGTTNQTSFASSLSSITRLVPDNVTIVAQGYSITTGINTMTINFTTPFTYTGGNLLVDFQSTTDGGWVRTYFYGVNQNTYTGYNSYNSSSTAGSNGHYSSGSTRQFLPKVTFTYEVETDPIHDLAIALDAQPSTVGAGGNVTLTATVTNNGDFDENGYTVTFTANGTTINTQTGGALAQGASATFTYTYTTTDAQGGTNVNFGASVACTDDAEASNNEATASTAVLACPPPENVAATPDGNSGTMTWDAPIIAPVPGTLIWDFEEEADFTAFTTIDSDGDGYNWAWHYNDNTAGSNLEVHSGNGQIYSQSYDKATSTVLYPDNWLISPEVTLGGTLSFWACGQDPNQYWNEVFAVYVCVGSYNGVSDFIKISPDITTTHAMTEYSYDLSQYQGQGYFAIRHYNVHDEFYLIVDDIALETMLPGEQPVSYNIYQEGQLVGNVDANTFTYTFNNLSDGTYNCAVSAVYSYGESAAVPTSFTIDTTNPTIEISPATQTISDAAAATLTVTGTDIDGNINVSAGNDWSLNPTSLGNTGGDVNVTYTGRALSASTTVTASATGATDATATVDYVADVYIVGNFGNGWNFNDNTHPMTYNNGIYTATLTANAGDYILFARLLGNDNPWGTRDVFGPVSGGDWWMQGNSSGGNLNLDASNCIYFPEGGTYTITIDATNGTFTITKPSEGQTASPVITYEVGDEYVTITATGDGTVTLNVPGYDPVSDEGSVSITVPRGYANNTITVTATAKEVNKDESVPTTQQIDIPAGSGWTEMDGEYNNPNDLLSFLKDDEDIMLIDQFRVSTLNNDHPDHYTYTLRQTVNGEEQRSTPVSIPVYKTSSTMQGLYTMEQIKSDKDMHLKANVVNTEMDFDVNPDRNVLYYNLYRGKKNDYYPTIADSYRVSQLQKYEEMDENENVHFFFKETYPSGIAPHYDHVANEIVERLDTNWVEAAYDDNLAYVPVIWTFGLYTARGDGKNNSYGSDIKRQTLGEVTAEAKIYYTTSPWGKFKDSNNVEYCIYYPEIKITGVCPVTMTAGDGDVYTYEPYMFRAWCTYEGARDFTSVDNALVDNGPKTVPFMLDSVIVVDPAQNIVTIGRDWLPSDTYKLPWAFGVPVTEDPQNVTFIVRFYYRQVVEEGGQQEGGSKLRLGNDAEEFFIGQGAPSAQSVVTAVNELFGGSEVVSVTYYNAQGMQSSKPFKGMNIIVTRYSDGSTSTMKVMK